MGPQSKLLIVEGLYPPRIDQSLESHGAAKNDVNMMVCTGGRQRSEAELRELFDAGEFELTRIVPTMAGVKVIEGVRAWRGAAVLPSAVGPMLVLGGSG